jgi:cytochrome P450
MEIVHDFASPIAFSAVASLLGMPTDDEDELLQLMQWSHTFSDVVSGYLLGNTQEVFHLKDYFHHLVEQKRREPSYDLISSFIHKKSIFKDDDTIVASCMMVLSAGHVTTKKLLGTGTNKMLEQWEDLRAQLPTNPGMLKLLCEELLRTGTPTRYIVRWAREDVDLAPQFPGEHCIQQGQKVLLFLEAGNYDPAFFAHPQQFVAQRHPNKHITFGHGKHKCPGASLARLETHTALELLLRFPDLQSDPKIPPQWNPNPNLGGFQAHSLRFCPVHTSSDLAVNSQMSEEY